MLLTAVSCEPLIFSSSALVVKPERFASSPAASFFVTNAPLEKPGTGSSPVPSPIQDNGALAPVGLFAHFLSSQFGLARKEPCFNFCK